MIATNLEAQRQVIGKLLLDSSLYYLHGSRIRPCLFADKDLNTYISNYCELIKQGIQPDAISLSQKSKQKDRSFNILSSICQEVKYEISIESALAHLENDFRNLRISVIGHTLVGMSLDTTNAEETLLWLKKQLLEVDLDGGVNTITAKDVGRGLIAKITDVLKNGEKRGMQTGILRYDEITGGLHPSDLVLVAGRTGQGKTSFALSMVKRLSKDQIPGLFISLEMSDDQLLGRLVSSDTGINSNSIHSIRLDEEQFERITTSVKGLERHPIYFYSGPSKLEALESSIRRHFILYSIKWVVVDYIQLVKNSGYGKNPETEIAEIARAFKNIAKELDIVIIAISQLSRPKEKDAEPKIFELRGSGQLEEASDQIIFVYRPEEYNIDSFQDGASTQGKAEIIIAKGRNTGGFAFRMDFVKHLTKFLNAGESEANSSIEVSQPIEPNINFQHEPNF